MPLGVNILGQSHCISLTKDFLIHFMYVNVNGIATIVLYGSGERNSVYMCAKKKKKECHHAFEQVCV